MKKILALWIGILASSLVFSQAFAVPAVGNQCGPVQLHLDPGQLTGVLIDVTGAIELGCQAGSSLGSYLYCTGGESVSLADQTCSPQYTVQVNVDGSVEIYKDVIACHSCADYESVFSGQCR